MKKFIIYWDNNGVEITTMEEAENLKKALKQVNYFEKKTGYEITGIEMVKQNEKKGKENILLDKE